MDLPSEYTANPWEDELKEREVDGDISDPESHQQTRGLESKPPLSDPEPGPSASPQEPSQPMLVQEPNQPAPVKKPKLRTDQRGHNQGQNQPTTTPQNPRYPSTNGLKPIWKSVHEKLDDLRQQVHDVGAEVQRSQGLVRAVKRQVKEVNNMQIIERVDRDAWMGNTEIGARLSLLQLEIDWIMHDLAQGRPTPRNSPFPARGRRVFRSGSPVMSTAPMDSEYFSEDESLPAPSPIRISPQQRRRREASPLPRRRNVIPESSHRRREMQYYSDEASGSITSGTAKYHTIPSYSRKPEGIPSAFPPRSQKFRGPLSRPQLRRKGSYVRRRPHVVEVEERSSDESQEDEQPERSASDDSSATKINDRSSESPVAAVQERQETPSQQENQGIGDQETGDEPGNEEGIHEKEAKHKLEEEAVLLQEQLSAIQEKIRLEEERKQAREEQDPTVDQATTCGQCDGVQSTEEDCPEQSIEDINERVDSSSDYYDDDSESNASHPKTNGRLRARFKETAGQIKSILTLHRKSPKAPGEMQWIKIHRDCWEWDKDDDNYIVIKQPLQEYKDAE